MTESVSCKIAMRLALRLRGSIAANKVRSNLSGTEKLMKHTHTRWKA